MSAILNQILFVTPTPEKMSAILNQILFVTPNPKKNGPFVPEFEND
jgi:hypothetical protein